MQENNKPNENRLQSTNFVSNGAVHKSHQNAYLHQYRSLNGGVKPKETVVTAHVGEHHRTDSLKSFKALSPKSPPESKPIESKVIAEPKAQIKQNSSLSRVNSNDIRYGIRGNSQIKPNKAQNLTIKLQKRQEIEKKADELEVKMTNKTSVDLNSIKNATEE